MRLSNSMPSQVDASIEPRTNHSENEQIYHPKFVWYVETSSSGDISPVSYHLTAFELTN